MHRNGHVFFRGCKKAQSPKKKHLKTKHGWFWGVTSEIRHACICLGLNQSSVVDQFPWMARRYSAPRKQQQQKTTKMSVFLDGGFTNKKQAPTRSQTNSGSKQHATEHRTNKPSLAVAPASQLTMPITSGSGQLAWHWNMSWYHRHTTTRHRSPKQTKTLFPCSLLASHDMDRHRITYKV